MEEPGEQCTVVFALIVTEKANECVFGGVTIRFRFRYNYAKTTVHAPGWIFVESYIMHIGIQLILYQTIIAVHKFVRNREEIYPSINKTFIRVEKQGKIHFY
jgi:hypothetical protein